jgi:hypothetical protein
MKIYCTNDTPAARLKDNTAPYTVFAPMATPRLGLFATSGVITHHEKFLVETFCGKTKVALSCVGAGARALGQGGSNG